MITLEEIAFNSLMPWSQRNSDEFLFEELNAALNAVKGYGIAIYFTTLSGKMRELGLDPGPGLAGEWMKFSGTNGNIREGLIRMLGSYRYSNQKVRYYAGLLSKCAFAELQLLGKDFEAHPDEHYRKYNSTKILVRLERIISSINPEKEHSEADLNIVKLVKLTAILMYLNVIANYGGVIHHEKLKLTPDAVFEVLAGIAMVSRNAASIANRIRVLYLPYFQNGLVVSGEVDSKNLFSAVKNINKARVQESVAKQVRADVTSESESKEDSDRKTDEERFIGAGEAMKILGCSKPSLFRYRKTKKIKFIQRYPKGHCKYLLSDVMAMVKVRNN